jgi:PHP family Zn ribbon phosphoesterase
VNWEPRECTVNIHVRAQKGYYLEQACTKCTYKRHIAIKQEVDIHEAGDKAIEKNMKSTGLCIYAFKSNLDQEACVFHPLSNNLI